MGQLSWAGPVRLTAADPSLMVAPFADVAVETGGEFAQNFCMLADVFGKSLKRGVSPRRRLAGRRDWTGDVVANAVGGGRRSGARGIVRRVMLSREAPVGPRSRQPRCHTPVCQEVADMAVAR